MNYEYRTVPLNLESMYESEGWETYSFSEYTSVGPRFAEMRRIVK